MNDQKYDVLDSEESAIVDAVENGEYIAEKNPSKRIGELQAAAAATVKKKPITVRIQEQDIQKIRSIAYQKGVPYQTLVSSVSNYSGVISINSGHRLS